MLLGLGLDSGVYFLPGHFPFRKTLYHLPLFSWIVSVILGLPPFRGRGPLFYRFSCNSALWIILERYLEAKSRQWGRWLGGNEGQRNWKDSLIVKGKQYEVFLFEQQGEPEYSLGKAQEVRHVVAGTHVLWGVG